MTFDRPLTGSERDKIDKFKAGIYEKFIVHRTDGRDGSGNKHYGCQYFVIDITHDAYAEAALLAYANACEGKYPFLADDLRKLF